MYTHGPVGYPQTVHLQIKRPGCDSAFLFEGSQMTGAVKAESITLTLSIDVCISPVRDVRNRGKRWAGSKQINLTGEINSCFLR